MPRREIDRSTNFIVEDESWSVVEYDHTSVPGVVYLSLTEGKINSIYDDVENDLADTNNIAKYELLTPESIQTFQIGDIIAPRFTLTKNGKLSDEPVIFSTTDKKIVRLIDNQLTAVGEGKCKLLATLQNYPDIIMELEIEVSGAVQEFDAYIEGNDKIYLDRTSDYALVGTAAIEGQVTYRLEATELAEILPSKDNICHIHANAKNLLGSIVLHAEYNGADYVKTISIIPLW